MDRMIGARTAADRRSSPEAEIRAATVTRLRELLPTARIMHEVVVNGCRADVLAVTPSHVVAVELKSAADTLKRLPVQLEEFGASAHTFIAVVHEKHARAAREIVSYRHPLWVHPRPQVETTLYDRWEMGYAWRNGPTRVQPAPRRLLGILWREELVGVARRLGVPFHHKAPMNEIVTEVALHARGWEIAHGVCAMLRWREVPEGDAPIAWAE